MENGRPDSDFASRQDDPFLQFNGLLYNFEFGSPISRNSRIFEAGSSDEANSYSRYRPRNPAARAKKSRYSWGGFDLAHRNQDAESQDDLIAILEHDESNMNEVTAAAPAPSSSSRTQRTTPQRRSRYQDNRRGGIVVDDILADSIAIGATVHRDSHTNLNANTHDNNNDNTTEIIQAFIPQGNTPEPSETPTPEKKRNIIRRWSLSLFGRRKIDTMSRGSIEVQYPHPPPLPSLQECGLRRLHASGNTMARKGSGPDGPLQTALMESTSAATIRAADG
ncbi:hypothetical protein TSTA_054870 [Talaromyces stipitatus ATCC 10500]|uniref:Uncharacterized protein n=1 Tax=Talaromyces stipitatus (strain ATCC 10500 / CBS 375.48 / QM 6759 / NRRL 1006) TaxID=441959 RepID=B8MR84_TALSN|nr:uncharacterized protein TSTA_054870 [Talaromyces stipitatus ATCC 10500]EED12979.1 hypothetical protein TSTA_054870 [Talaromyces stipitatus ATCC 10500]